MKIVVSCFVCGKTWLKYRSQLRLNQRCYCSPEHKTEDYRIRFKGKNNPNFENKWSEDKKIQQSKTVSELMKDPLLRFKAGTANRGKKFNQTRIDNMFRDRTPRIGWKHDEETLKIIGFKSAAKFTPEYKKRQRELFEKNGYWIPLEEKSIYDLYFKEASWVKSMWNIIEDSRELLKNLNVFHPRKNSKGVVRDHRYGRQSGCREGVFPIILRHPCNCEILTHSENVKKKKGRYVDHNSISLSELFELIRSFRGEWFEHEETLIAIQDYETGKRWITHG